MKITNTEFIIDASFIASRLLPDESNPIVDSYFKLFLRREIRFFAPSLIQFEIANILRSCVLRKRITFAEAERLLYLYSQYSLSLMEVSINEVLKLADEKNISVYDACYIWLAQARGVELLTLDVKLKNLV
jgi:predicted nucleic acid-binding protein